MTEPRYHGVCRANRRCREDWEVVFRSFATDISIVIASNLTEKAAQQLKEDINRLLPTLRPPENKESPPPHNQR